MPPSPKGGAKPPSILAAPPAAPVEPVSAVAAAEPAQAPTEPAKGNVGAANGSEGSSDIAEAAATLARLTVAAQPEPALPESQAPAPAARYVAVYPICGADGRTEPGQPYQPGDDAERLLFLAQGVIRPV